jgi:hypothetical protein
MRPAPGTAPGRKLTPGPDEPAARHSTPARTPTRPRPPLAAQSAAAAAPGSAAARPGRCDTPPPATAQHGIWACSKHTTRHRQNTTTSSQHPDLHRRSPAGNTNGHGHPANQPARGIFSHAEATLTDATALTPCRLRHAGSAHQRAAGCRPRQPRRLQQTGSLHRPPHRHLPRRPQHCQWLPPEQPHRLSPTPDELTGETTSRRDRLGASAPHSSSADAVWSPSAQSHDHDGSFTRLHSPV